MKTVSIINLKGGVGKTMTAIHMADILASDYGQRVLLADCDGQGNLTAFFQADTECVTLADILAAQHEPYWIDNVQETGVPGVRLIPATSDLYGLDIAAIRRGSTSLGALRDFRDAVIEDGEEDWFIFDCPPGFTAASCAALLAADFVVVPVLIDGFSTAGMTDLLEQIASLRVVNPAIRVGVVLITQYRTSQAVQAGAAAYANSPRLCRTGCPCFAKTKAVQSSSARLPRYHFACRPRPWPGIRARLDFPCPGQPLTCGRRGPAPHRSPG